MTARNVLIFILARRNATQETSHPVISNDNLKLHLKLHTHILKRKKKQNVK